MDALSQGQDKYLVQVLERKEKGNGRWLDSRFTVVHSGSSLVEARQAFLRATNKYRDDCSVTRRLFLFKRSVSYTRIQLLAWQPNARDSLPDGWRVLAEWSNKDRVAV